jgi:hypothetical protein
LRRPASRTYSGQVGDPVCGSPGTVPEEIVDRDGTRKPTDEVVDELECIDNTAR